MPPGREYSMEKRLMSDIMCLQAAEIHRRIALMANTGILDNTDKATLDMLYEAVSRAYKEVAALDSKAM